MQQKGRHSGKETASSLTPQHHRRSIVNITTRARTRTWTVVTEYRPCGEDWGSATDTVTLTRTPIGLVAEINGKEANLELAVRLLNGATRVTVTAEILEMDPNTAALEAVTARAWNATLDELEAEPGTSERTHLARRARRLSGLRRALVGRAQQWAV